MSFDSFAEKTAKLAARAPFFMACVLLVVIWLPSILVVGNIDTWQLLINTPTTIITFLLVALLQNSQARSERALQMKLDAIAAGLADLMESLSKDNPNLEDDTDELRHAVGIEEEIGATE